MFLSMNWIQDFVDLSGLDKIELIRKSWDSVYKAGVGGAYNWVSDSKEEIESTQTVISGTGPVNFSLIPKKCGKLHYSRFNYR